MTLTYSELMDLCSLGKRLRHWTLAYPSNESGLGIRVLRESWQFLPVANLQSDPQLITIVQEITNRRVVKSDGAATVDKPK